MLKKRKFMAYLITFAVISLIFFITGCVVVQADTAKAYTGDHLNTLMETYAGMVKVCLLVFVVGNVGEHTTGIFSKGDKGA